MNSDLNIYALTYRRVYQDSPEVDAAIDRVIQDFPDNKSCTFCEFKEKVEEVL